MSWTVEKNNRTRVKTGMLKMNGVSGRDDCKLDEPIMLSCSKQLTFNLVYRPEDTSQARISTSFPQSPFIAVGTSSILNDFRELKHVEKMCSGFWREPSATT